MWNRGTVRAVGEWKQAWLLLVAFFGDATDIFPPPGSPPSPFPVTIFCVVACVCVCPRPPSLSPQRFSQVTPRGVHARDQVRLFLGLFRRQVRRASAECFADQPPSSRMASVTLVHFMTVLAGCMLHGF